VLSAVHVTGSGDTHVAKVAGPANAVVVVIVGSGRLTALDGDGHRVGPSRNVD